MQTIGVNTVFSVVDEATGPLAQIAKTADEVKRNVEKAQDALKQTGGAPGGARGVGKISPEERDKFKEDKELFLAMRQRKKHMKVAMAEENVMHRTAMTATMLLAGEQHGLVATLAKNAVMVQAVGMDMSTVGGKAGELGMKMSELAGKAVAVGGAWEVGYAVGEKLNEGSEALHKVFEGMGEKGHSLEEAFMTLGGPVGLLYRALTAENRAHDEVLKGNEKYAKSLGYRNAAEFGAIRGIRDRIEHEKKLSVQIDQEVKNLAALPTDKTGEAMDEYNRSLIEAARRMGVAPDKMDEAVEKLKQASEHSVKSLTTKANRESELATIIDQEAKTISAMPLHATIEKQKQYNEVIGAHIQSLVTAKAITQEEAAEQMERLRQRIDERGSVENAIKAIHEEESSSIQMNDAVQQQIKRMKVLPLNATAQQMIAFNDTLETTAYQIAQGLGKAGDPEAFKKIFEEVKQAATEKQKRVYDFRNSRFDIKQQFAEGFDPDRISVAFTNDLAKLGERALEAKTVSHAGGF